jgi:hypothetical protein
MNDHSGPRISSTAISNAQPDSPDLLEPFGDGFVRFTRPRCEEINAIVAANRMLVERPLPQLK